MRNTMSMKAKRYVHGVACVPRKLPPRNTQFSFIQSNMLTQKQTPSLY